MGGRRVEIRSGERVLRGRRAGVISWSGLLVVVLSLAAAYAALGLILYVFQDRLVYFPDKLIIGTPHDRRLAYETVRLSTEDQVDVFGWYVPADGPWGTILFCHGNAGNISHRLVYLEIFHRLGLNTFIFDYRGFGRSSGSPSEEGTYRDSEAAWRFLVVDKGIPPHSIAVYGESLGGAVAARLAAAHRPGALILASAFTSLPELGADLYPFLPVRHLARFRYPTLEHVRRVECPILVIHSPDDEIVPFRHGKALREGAGNLGELLVIQGDHNSGFVTSGDVYERGLEAFLARHFALTSAGDPSPHAYRIKSIDPSP